MTRYSKGFSTMPAPIASGWGVCRVGLCTLEKRRLATAHTLNGHSFSICSVQGGFRSRQSAPLHGRI
jgi:hypothetical protein